MRIRARINTLPIAELPSAIVTALRARPQTTAQLAEQLGFAESTIRARLSELVLERRIHRTSMPSLGNSGVRFVWHIGHREESIAATLVHRDPLVAALFGPAHRVSA